MPRQNPKSDISVLLALLLRFAGKFFGREMLTEWEAKRSGRLMTGVLRVFLVEIAGNYSRVGAIFEQMSSSRYSAACLDLTRLRYGVMRFGY